MNKQQKVTTLEEQIAEKIQERDVLQSTFKLTILEIRRLSRELFIMTCKSIEDIPDHNFGTKRKPEIHQVKFGVYDQGFPDGDTGEIHMIERRSIIELDGKPYDNQGELK